VYPAVEEKMSRLRFFVSNVFTEDELKEVAGKVIYHCKQLDVPCVKN
jgi:hypothetical protein